MAVPTPQFYCSLCDEDDLEFAIAYCEDDNQNYCRAHLDSHAAFPSTRTHRTHDLLNTQGKTHCDHTDEQTSYCKDHQVLCCIPCKVFGHSECESVNNVGDYLKNKDIIKEKCSRMSRKMKSRKNIVDKKSSSAHDQEDKWISKMNEAVTQMNEVKAELERKISNKIDYVRQIMNKKRESLDNEQAQLEEAIEQLDNIMTVIPEGHSKLETFQAVYNAEKTIKQCEQIQKTRPGNCHIEFLKAEHNFEAQHYVNGSLLCFTQAVEKINRVYSEIQKYLPHIREEESDEPVRMAPFSAIQEESIPLVHKLHVPDSNIQNDETMRKLQVPQPRTRSRSLDCSSAIYRGRDHRRRLSDCYESLISYSEKEAYPSIPTRQQCVMMVRCPDDDPYKKCCITGIAPIENNAYMVMADYTNSKLKLFATCGTLEDEMKFEAVPRDIAKVDDSTILVNFPMAKNIQIIKIELDKNTKMKKLKIEGTKIHTHAKCCGIAYHNDLVYVATQIPHQIIIMTLHGNIKKQSLGKIFLTEQLI
ncbi:uncharacterized protein LOC128231517 [Mya arenaria]|uniref:uncharacterized protein LOC128231517 n=1 Tax=Mya arenaria TaxID=6604 RepID=UPI0022E0EC09|nr:uncharacterized protein LOC128231517 [Mya arenaria]XP_052800416.1 uncharacterized protein LOC128231517 [Mya arenaria]